MNKNLIKRPLVAVIETSEERAMAGRPPVVVSIRPMNPVKAWFRGLLSKRANIDIYTDKAECTSQSEYVVELHPDVSRTLTGCRSTCKLVLVPTTLSRVCACACQESEARP